MLNVAENDLTDRQRAVLDASLSLLVEAGDGLTMAAVARRARCSKETLYKWFGDRDGLLVATVQWQAAGVRPVRVEPDRLDMASLAAGLGQFASDWLSVVSTKSSIALNRLAVSRAGPARSGLGAIVLENGRFAMGRRLKPLIEDGRNAGLLAFADAEEAFRTFFGLVARDLQIRLLLGDRIALNATEIARESERAARQFLALYGAPHEPGGPAR